MSENGILYNRNHYALQTSKHCHAVALLLKTNSPKYKLLTLGHGPENRYNNRKYLSL